MWLIDMRNCYLEAILSSSATSYPGKLKSPCSNKLSAPAPTEALTLLSPMLVSEKATRTFSLWMDQKVSYFRSAANENVSQRPFSLAEPKKPNLLTLDVDLNALVYTSHLAYWAFGQANKESQSSRTGTLLLLGSVASLTNTPETPLYGAAKHGVLGLFRSLRTPHLFTEMNRNKSKDGKTNVTVNLLCPYFTDTNIIRDESGKKSLPDFVQLSKIEKVIEAATRLVTDKEGGKALVIMPKELAKGRGKDGIWQLEKLQAKL
jgi:hypothetical protein